MYIRYIEELTNYILLPSTYSNLNIYRIILNIGPFKKEVNIKIDNDLKDDVIGLSKDLKDWYYLPEDLIYEVIIKNRNIYIGPIIGILASTSKRNLNDDMLNKLEKYYLDYDNILGLIYVCSSGCINKTNKTIEGYYFNKNKWIKGIFPYPGALFRRTGISKYLYDDLVLTIGNNLFNSYFFDKWELWDYLSKDKNMRKYLPETKKLISFNDIEEMINKHRYVYLKLINSCKARGIIKVEKINEKYKFIYRLKKEKILDIESTLLFINDLIKDNYLIQQAINIKKYDNRIFDFRVIMQKNQYKKWDCIGIIARFGAKNSIATNFILEGYALSGKEALMKVFKMNEKEAFIKLEEIKDVCLKACSILDKTIGNYGDLGIDLIVDENKKIWILEINKLHDQKYPIYSINDTEMYYKVITNPIKYVKALAGFEE